VWYLRTDAYHHRIAIHPGAKRGTAYTGWEVAGERQLEAAAADLESRGLSLTWADKQGARIRKVARFFEVTDPSGFRVGWRADRSDWPLRLPSPGHSTSSDPAIFC
jgi:hypothetical protein